MILEENKIMSNIPETHEISITDNMDNMSH